MSRRTAYLNSAILLAVLALLAIMPPARAESVRDLIRKGNEAVAAGDFKAAEEAYENASVEDPESPYLYINRGVIAFREDDYEKAREAFKNAIPKCEDALLEAKCQYNIGNCWYREGRRQQDSDLQKALEACKNAIEHYQDANRLDPQLAKAGRNLEVARLTMKNILDEIKKKQEEQQKQQQQQQQLMKELEELIARQDAALARNDAVAKTKNSSGPSPDVQQQTRELAGDQKQLSNDTNIFSDKIKQVAAQGQPQGPQPAQPQRPPPGTPPNPAQEAAKHLDNAVTHQDAASRQLNRQNLPGAKTNQQTAAEALKKAKEALTPPPQDNQEQQQQQQQQQGNNQQQEQKEGEKKKEQGEKDGDKKPEEEKNGEKKQQGKQGEDEKQKGEEEKQEEQKQARATKVDDRAARDILDDEKRNRERRRVPSGGVAPVDRDW